MFRNMYTSVLGRLFLVIIVVYFASNNILFGLLSVLIIAIGSQMLMHNGILEGMENKINVITTEDLNKEVATGAGSPVTTVAPDTTVPVGPTTSNIAEREEAIRPKQAKTIPVDKKPMTNDEPVASSTEAFSIMGSNF